MLREQDMVIPASRFSNRAYNYQLYRPAYLPEIRTFIEQHMQLKKTDHIADIGCGTGRFAELFLRDGYAVTGIEPNEEMREAAGKKLGGYRLFNAMNGRAEDTGLPSESVDMITVAQAFHWLDLDSTREEFKRILRPGGHVVLLWNIRETNTPFLAGYDQLKKQFREKPAPLLVRPDEIRQFFEPAIVKEKTFRHSVWMDFDSLKGLLLSSSGIPLPGQSQYDTMISALVQLFVAYNHNGFVNMEYLTRMYWV